MSTLAPNAFIGRAQQPADADLGKALGSVKPLWDGLIAELAAQHGVAGQEWKSYSSKSGWALRLTRGKRTILWMAPCEGCFRVSFILGDKAVETARRSSLSARVLKLIDQAERYPEGTGVRLRIKSPKDIRIVRQLTEIKLAN